MTGFKNNRRHNQNNGSRRIKAFISYFEENYFGSRFTAEITIHEKKKANSRFTKKPFTTLCECNFFEEKRMVYAYLHNCVCMPRHNEVTTSVHVTLENRSVTHLIYSVTNIAHRKLSLTEQDIRNTYLFRFFPKFLKHLSFCCPKFPLSPCKDF